MHSLDRHSAAYSVFSLKEWKRETDFGLRIREHIRTHSLVNRSDNSQRYSDIKKKLLSNFVTNIVEVIAKTECIFALPKFEGSKLRFRQSAMRISLTKVSAMLFWTMYFRILFLDWTNEQYWWSVVDSLSHVDVGWVVWSSKLRCGIYLHVSTVLRYRVMQLMNIQERLVLGALGHAESEFSTYLCAQTIWSLFIKIWIQCNPQHKWWARLNSLSASNYTLN